ncbi:heavy-metal-associated domain-containing protein [Marinobacter fonticola]|uniref:heavy-metal-associated domain-containing protein n=1 Tax=Marinobacter fonticola TaxID=2603215 RepID=UPI0011E6399D|nr:heavy metal-associated domain-containing protein [Marinobacter fonticola]
MKTTTLSIKGMHCDGCVQIVQHMLEQQAGVKGCSVSLDAKQARVAHDADRVSAETLAESVRTAGYEALPTEN